MCFVFLSSSPFISIDVLSYKFRSLECLLSSFIREICVLPRRWSVLRLIGQPDLCLWSTPSVYRSFSLFCLLYFCSRLVEEFD